MACELVPVLLGDVVDRVPVVVGGVVDQHADRSELGARPARSPLSAPAMSVMSQRDEDGVRAGSSSTSARPSASRISTKATFAPLAGKGADDVGADADRTAGDEDDAAGEARIDGESHGDGPFGRR